MALPTLEKTWQFKVNRPVGGGASNLLSQLNKQLVVEIKNALTDKITGQYGPNGTSVQIRNPTLGGLRQWEPSGGGSSIRFSPNWAGNLVGKTVQVRGCGAGEDGNFTITHQGIGGFGNYVIEYDNNGASGTVAATGSISVMAGEFSTPWVLSHSGDPGDFSTTQDDEVDRHFDGAEFTASISTWSQFILRNTVTGSEWLITGDGNSTSYDMMRCRMRTTTAPNRFTIGGSNSVANGTPNAAGGNNHRETASDAATFMTGDTDTTGAQGNYKLHVMVSDDGEETRVFVGYLGTVYLAWIDGAIKNPHPLLTAPGVTLPAFTAMRFGTNQWGFTIFNDSDQITLTSFNEPGAGPGNPSIMSPQGEQVRHVAQAYMTAEGAISSAVAQIWTGQSELSGKWEMYPIGIAQFAANVRSRVGEIKDLWWLPTGVSTGRTFPDDLSRQFIALNDMALPWNGSVLEMG